MAEQITLNIKAANQSFVDQKMDCSLDETVLFVKNEISKTHPGKPSLAEQRLIYSGHLLQDHVPLRSVLRYPSENNEFTIHLVYSTHQKKTDKKITEQSRPTNTPSPSSRPSPPVILASVNGSRPNSSHADVVASEIVTDGGGGGRHFVPSSDSTLGAQQQGYNPSTLYPHFPQLLLPLQSVVDPIEQMAAMQQMYSQYMTSYMQYMQSGTIESLRHQEIVQTTSNSSSAGSVSIAPTSVTAASEPIDQQNTRQRHQQQPDQIQNNRLEGDQQQNPQLRMNAQGGVGDEEEEGVARDWLDYIYFASRMTVLLSIVYFYSTVTRFMLVVCTSILIYLYQSGWLRIRRDIEEQPLQNGGAEAQENVSPTQEASVAQQEQPPQESENNELHETIDETKGVFPEVEGNTVQEEPEAISETTTNVPDGPLLTENPEEVPPPPSLISLSWTFLTTFFTSLIPDQHQIV